MAIRRKRCRKAGCNSIPKTLKPRRDPNLKTMSTLQANPDPTITLALANPAASNQAIVYVNVAAVLNVTLNNATGTDVTMQPGDNASTLEIYMPGFFTSQEISGMTITDISQPGWQFKYYITDGTLLLTYTGTAAKWADTTSLTFNINNVISTAAPTMDAVQVNFNNLGGDNVPAQQTANLALNQQITPGDADITKVIDVNLDNQGSIFVSVETDPLSNTLTLNFKNKTDNPLYNDTELWKGNPVVTVTFVYGTTAGALAPDQKTDSTVPGSAWLISVSADAAQNWGYKNPVITDQGTSPKWTMFPNPTNKDIIGTKENANVSFQFSNIDSFTPTGHTQMYVQFSGFPATSTQQYNTYIFMVDIVKQPPPATRGLISFFSTQPSIINLEAPAQGISIPLKWYMYYVDNISMICNVPGIGTLSRDYYQGGQAPFVPLNNDSYSLVLPMLITQSTAVLITLQAYDKTGAYLNSLQFTVFINADFFADPMGQVYKTVLLNNQTWLAQNYNYNSGPGCLPYNNDPKNQAAYGMLYTFAAAAQNTPPGWRIPTQADWQALINLYGANAFTALQNSGANGFSAVLGGYGQTPQTFNNLGTSGYYWANLPDSENPGKYMMCALNGPPFNSVNVNGSYPYGYFISVRYVKNT